MDSLKMQQSIAKEYPYLARFAERVGVGVGDLLPAWIQAEKAIPLGDKKDLSIRLASVVGIFRQMMRGEAPVERAIEHIISGRSAEEVAGELLRADGRFASEVVKS